MSTLIQQAIEHRIDENIARALRDMCVREADMYSLDGLEDDAAPDGNAAAYALLAHNIKVSIIRQVMGERS